MVLIGLLLVALVCLALGLVLASAAWLVGSLAATAAAAYLMWTKRTQIAVPASSAAAPTDAKIDPETDSTAGGTLDADYLQRREEWFEAGTADGDVWVVDGRPSYHASGCRLLIDEQAEPIPFSQATEDGFTPCEVCAPVVVAVPTEAHVPSEQPVPTEVPLSTELPSEHLVAESLAEEPLPDPAAANAGGEVWVIDGRPDYHVSDCGRLLGEDAEAIPFDQAVEDGFAACRECHPPLAADETVVFPAIVDEPIDEPIDEPAPTDEPVFAVAAAAPVEQPVAAAVEPEPAAPDEAVGEPVGEGRLSDVWVVDGRPRYHRSDCMIIKGQDAEPVPFDQAADDGFMPCSLCEPNALSR